MTGTTTITTGTVTNLGLNQSTSDHIAQYSSYVRPNISNTPLTGTTSTAPTTVVSVHRAHVHQPPSSSITKSEQQSAVAPQVTANHMPLAGGWLIGESAKGTLITNNNQLLSSYNNNNNSNTISSYVDVNLLSETGTSSTSDTNLIKNYASPSVTSSISNSELLANGHGPRREVSIKLI